MKYLINFFVEKFFKVNRANKLKAKEIMISEKEFKIQNLKLGNIYKVNEQIFVKDFVSKIIEEKLTIVVVDNKGQTKGYINEKQLDIFNVLNSDDKKRTIQ